MGLAHSILIVRRGIPSYTAGVQFVCSLLVSVRQVAEAERRLLQLVIDVPACDFRVEAGKHQPPVDTMIGLPPHRGGKLWF